MSESKNRSTNQMRHLTGKYARKRLARIDPRSPWKRSWWVLWGFITVVGEVVLIFLTKAKLANPSTLQLAVIGICIPIVAHMLISGVRTFLFVTSSR